MHLVAESKGSAQVNVASNLSAQTIDVVVPTEIGGQSNTKVGIFENADVSPFGFFRAVGKNREWGYRKGREREDIQSYRR